MKTFGVILVYVINAFSHLTRANPQSYEGKARNGYTDSTESYILNFGNGENKDNIVNINETPDRLSFSGASFSNDNGAPVQKVNVDFNNPNYRGGPQDPNIYYNPKATRTRISNIGNGEGNRNVFVFNDNRNDPPRSRNNQDGYNGYRGQSNYGHHGDAKTITNIGRGPDNNNKFYVNGERVYPSSAATGVHRKATEQITSIISDVSQYANDFGNGYKNSNRIIINTTDSLNPNPVSNNINVPNKHHGYETGETTKNTNENHNTNEDVSLKVIPIDYKDKIKNI